MLLLVNYSEKYHSEFINYRILGQWPHNGKIADRTNHEETKQTSQHEIKNVDLTAYIANSQYKNGALSMLILNATELKVSEVKKMLKNTWDSHESTAHTSID